MSTDVALQAMFDRFVGRFVVPLIRGGGRLLVSLPIGPGALSYFEAAAQLGSEELTEVFQAREAALRQLTPGSTFSTLEADDLRLLAALHNVLLCDHEEFVGGMLGRNRWAQCTCWTQSYLESLPVCLDPDLALRRHSLIHLAPELSRQDVVVRTRVGVKRYHGQEPPRRALIWPRLRRVSTDEVQASLAEVVTSAEARGLLTRVLELSPLTCLLALPYARQGTIHRVEFRWTPSVVSVLRRPSLCREVTYRHLDYGLEVVGPVLTRAIVAGLEQLSASPDEALHEALAFGLRYLVNLQLTHVWTASREGLTAPMSTTWTEGARELRGLFFGWLAVALSREDRIGAPEPEDREHGQRQLDYRRAASIAAGEQLADAARQVDLIISPLAQQAQQGGPP